MINPKFHHFQTREKLTKWSQSAFADRFFLLLSATWVLAIILTTAVILFSFPFLPKEIPLFYSRPWGDPQLATTPYIFLPVAGSLLLGIFNLGMGVTYHPKDKVLSYLLIGTTTLVSILSLVTTFNIILLFR